MWIKADDDVAINTDQVLYAAWSGTGGGVRFYISTSTFIAATFGTTEAQAKAAISRLLRAVDPANYVV